MKKMAKNEFALDIDGEKKEPSISGKDVADAVWKYAKKASKSASHITKDIADKASKIEIPTWTMKKIYNIVHRYKKVWLWVWILWLIIFLWIPLLQGMIVNMTYNNIPALYEETVRLNDDPTMVMYIDNTIINVPTKSIWFEWWHTLVKGLYAEWKENNDNFAWYVSYETTDDYEMDQLLLQREYDSLLDVWIEIVHKQNWNTHILQWWHIDSRTSLYETDLFQWLNRKVKENTFWAIWLIRNSDAYQETMYGDSGLTSRINNIALERFPTRNIITALMLDDVMKEANKVIDDRLSNFNSVYYTFNNLWASLEIKIYVEWDSFKPLESVAKSICSKLKTEHLESEKNSSYGLKNQDCQNKITDNDFIITVSYDDFANHLQWLRQ